MVHTGDLSFNEIGATVMYNNKRYGITSADTIALLYKQLDREKSIAGTYICYDLYNSYEFTINSYGTVQEFEKC